ncbi:hypothetical protein [Thalassobacillus sp. B23F22_16]|uniref:hypothetical protein n=1 Tax=Thalassobacillus sp. B23F22_16 TaxID=3459513 RepID=UPI00373E3AFB
MNIINEIVFTYHNKTKKDKHHRYKSWEHCYTYFHDNHRSLNEDGTLDKGSLHLAFYLASWGMLRGGSILLQKDYLVHEHFLKQVVSKRKYHKYFNLEYKLNLDDSYLEGINELIEDTRYAYETYIAQTSEEEPYVRLSDTLTSKILLGVYGNVPAYDRYFKRGLKLHGIKDNFEHSLGEVVDFYTANKEAFEECQRRYSVDGTVYTPMKLIDMYFFQVGLMLENTSTEPEKMDQLKAFAESYAEAKHEPEVEKLQRTAGETDRIRNYLVDYLKQAKEEGQTYVDLKSGDLHRMLELKNRMPSVCNAMTSIGAFTYEILHDTPSGASSTRLVRYYLNKENE